MPGPDPATIPLRVGFGGRSAACLPPHPVMNAPIRTDAGWRLEHSYEGLPGLFHSRLDPVPVRQPELILFNRTLAVELGLDPGALDSPEGALIFGGNVLPPGARPLAQAYAGHQFGHFTMLGDGRALLLGEQRCPDSRLMDIQLKGSGPTPYSRRGDGRAALGPMLREYLISEAMHALGIPSTRSLAVVRSGEPVLRETPQMGAILTRVAASHIRVGTFEYPAALRDTDALRALADYTLRRHDPAGLDAPNPYMHLLEQVIRRQALLMAQWLLSGFIHGVMNTDNMALSGETIDYGPCAFMDVYDPDTVFSSIDSEGRYAYARQPNMAHWNLTRFAEALIPLLHPVQEEAIELARTALAAFPEAFHNRWAQGMRDKLGLSTREEDDPELIRDLLAWMHRRQADYTRTFRALAEQAFPDDPAYADPFFQSWLTRWEERLARQPEARAKVALRMRRHSPAIIPRNHLVEEVLQSAVEGNMRPFTEFLNALADPYGEHPADSPFRQPPPEGRQDYRTFCGT